MCLSLRDETETILKSAAWNREQFVIRLFPKQAAARWSYLAGGVEIVLFYRVVGVEIILFYRVVDVEIILFYRVVDVEIILSGRGHVFSFSELLDTSFSAEVGNNQHNQQICHLGTDNRICIPVKVYYSLP